MRIRIRCVPKHARGEETNPRVAEARCVPEKKDIPVHTGRRAEKFGRIDQTGRGQRDSIPIMTIWI